MAMTAPILALLSFAAWRDLATRTIPDMVSVALVTVGAACRLYDGWESLGLSAATAIAVFLVLLPFHARGLVGGADLKLLAALALGLSPLGLYQLITATALAGGVLAGIYLALRRVLNFRPPKGTSLVRHRFLPFRIAAVESWRIRRGAPLPYGVAIAAGAALVILNRPGV